MCVKRSVCWLSNTMWFKESIKSQHYPSGFNLVQLIVTTDNLKCCQVTTVADPELHFRGGGDPSFIQSMMVRLYFFQHNGGGGFKKIDFLRIFLGGGNFPFNPLRSTTGPPCMPALSW